MRRLDWALAAMIVAFLIGALAIETQGGLMAHVSGAHMRGFAPQEVSLRRLAPRLSIPTFPGEAR